MSMDALLVGSDHLRALSAIFHHEHLTVASAASGRNIRVVHARLGIAGWQQLVRTTVAVDASCGVSVPALYCGCVETAIVSGLFIGVAGSASDFLSWRFVSGTLDIGMAINAGKHRCVNRIFEGLRVHIKADRLAVHIMSKGRITVTGQAIFYGRFRMLLASGVQVRGT